jgi:hypothetical protein
MLKKIAAPLILVSLLAGSAAGELIDILKNTFQVQAVYKKEDEVFHRRGTAFLVTQNKTRLFLLSSGHLVAGKEIESISIKHWWDGETPFIKADLLGYRYNPSKGEDVSVLKVSKKPFITLEAIPLSDRRVSIGVFHITYGCAYSRKPTLRIGRTKLFNKFGYNIKKGRSGSLISDLKGHRIYGMLIRQDGSFVDSIKLRQIFNELKEGEGY